MRIGESSLGFVARHLRGAGLAVHAAATRAEVLAIRERRVKGVGEA